MQLSVERLKQARLLRAGPAERPRLPRPWQEEGRKAAWQEQGSLVRYAHAASLQPARRRGRAPRGYLLNCFPAYTFHTHPPLP